MRLINYIRKVWLVVLILVLFNIGFAYAAEIPMPATDLPTIEFKDILINIINWVAAIATTIAVLVIIIAGILWTTASGNEDQLSTARKMLVSGLIGLIITLGAWAVVRTVTSAVF